MSIEGIIFSAVAWLFIGAMVLGFLGDANGFNIEVDHPFIRVMIALFWPVLIAYGLILGAWKGLRWIIFGDN